MTGPGALPGADHVLDPGVDPVSGVDAGALAAPAPGVPGQVKVVCADELIARARLEELERIRAFPFSAATFKISGRTYIVTSPLRSAERRSSDVAPRTRPYFANARAERGQGSGRRVPAS